MLYNSPRYAFKFWFLPPCKRIDNFSLAIVVCLRFEFQFLFTLNSFLIKRYDTFWVLPKKILHYSREEAASFSSFFINRRLFVNVKKYKLQFMKFISNLFVFTICCCGVSRDNKFKFFCFFVRSQYKAKNYIVNFVRLHNV